MWNEASAYVRTWKELSLIHISEPTRQEAISYAVFCLKKKMLSLACASGRLSFAVGERYYCVYFLSAISFHVRTYADASFHITIQARSTNTRFTYVQSSTLIHGDIFDTTDKSIHY